MSGLPAAAIHRDSPSGRPQSRKRFAASRSSAAAWARSPSARRCRLGSYSEVNPEDFPQPLELADRALTVAELEVRSHEGAAGLLIGPVELHDLLPATHRPKQLEATTPQPLAVRRGPLRIAVLGQQVAREKLQHGLPAGACRALCDDFRGSSYTRPRWSETNAGLSQLPVSAAFSRAGIVLGSPPWLRYVRESRVTYRGSDGQGGCLGGGDQRTRLGYVRAVGRGQFDRLQGRVRAADV